ncbi:class I SAM-dependent RNA methyltransferase [Hoyosella subflava]|uniref:Putative RNA methyltransferase n=1 Tax=Hoyosella subflava (strain DSM 45089 / JCM 17490 / NBRC 109087 / DQS3-9A1) TaxID=443218 RepID=F6ELH3_HOYSD|nr:TRAM domain-containing protein [Hoyosella subflava]AEF40223.1 putative RNA methyltransferase [Hoyosella subflava DQS3-9A1]
MDDATERWRGQTVEVTLGDPAHGGWCVSRHDGRVVFVRRGIPGERVRALITDDRGGSHCFAETVDVVDPSPDRVESVCSVSDAGAGCCDLAHILPSRQLDVKSAVVSGQLRRIAHIDRAVGVETLPRDLSPGAVSVGGWRTRVRLGVDRTGAAGFRRHRSNDLVTRLDCPQPVPGLLSGIGARKWTAGAELQVVRDGDGTRHIIEIAPAHAGRRRPNRTDSAEQQRRSAAARRAARARPRSEAVREGSGRAVEYVQGRAFEIAASGFWQAHTSAAEQYAGIVAEWADLRPGEGAWDLYSGAGVFASVLGAQTGSGGYVEAVEAAPQSVRDGVAAVADLPQVRFHRGATERVIDTLSANPAVVVLDPPRVGAGRAVISKVAAAAPRRIIHIGCDPAAFARDCALYRAAGYSLAELRAFDAFPLTHHVECVGMFVRNR